MGIRKFECHSLIACVFVFFYSQKYDTQETLRLKCDLLADWIKGARHVVVHTGAGISTAAGIPDFRCEKEIVENLLFSSYDNSNFSPLLTPQVSNHLFKLFSLLLLLNDHLINYNTR